LYCGLEIKYFKNEGKKVEIMSDDYSVFLDGLTLRLCSVGSRWMEQ
jgi:hypothetical protein